MKTPTRLAQSRWRSGVALVLAAWLWAVPATAAPAAGTLPPTQDPIVTLGENSAEITLPRPTHYAVLLHAAGKFRTLHTRGDVLLHPQDPRQSLTIERVEAGTVYLRERHTQRTRSLRIGKPTLLFPGVLLTGTVVLDKVQYRSKPVEHLTRPDPVVVAIQGSRAVVEVEVLGSVSVPSPAALAPASPSAKSPLPKQPGPSPAGPLPAPANRHKLDPALFAEVPVKEVEANIYEVDAASVMPAIENVGQVLADLQPMITPALSTQSGLTFNLTSSVVDGTLSNAGFTVTNSKIARRFGIEVGDIIKRFNGHEVNSPLDAWMAYQEFIIRNPLQSEMRVDLQHNGIPTTKLYRTR